jgi:hypothetical protein
MSAPRYAQYLKAVERLDRFVQAQSARSSWHRQPVLRKNRLRSYSVARKLRYVDVRLALHRPYTFVIAALVNVLRAVVTI